MFSNRKSELNTYIMVVLLSYFRIPFVSVTDGRRFACLLIPMSATTRRSQENTELTVGDPVDCNSSTMYAICGVNIFSLQIECKQNSYRPSSSQQQRRTLTQIAMWYNVHKAAHSCRPVCQRDDSIEHGKTPSGCFSQVANRIGSGETREDRIDTAGEKEKKSVIARRHDDNVGMGIMFSTRIQFNKIIKLCAHMPQPQQRWSIDDSIKWLKYAIHILSTECSGTMTMSPALMAPQKEKGETFLEPRIVIIETLCNIAFSSVDNLLCDVAPFVPTISFFNSKEASTINRAVSKYFELFTKGSGRGLFLLSTSIESE